MEQKRFPRFCMDKQAKFLSQPFQILINSRKLLVANTVASGNMIFFTESKEGIED